MKQAITIAQTIDLLARAHTQFVDGHEAVVQVGHITGDPENGILHVSWVNHPEHHQDYGMTVIEEGLVEGTQKIWWDDEEGLLYLPDDDGDDDNPLILQLVVKMGRKYLTA